MPIYEYACTNCKHTLDALQKMSDDPLTECPECGKATLKKCLSAPRFRLKGQGWYETDFKKDNQRNVLKSDSESTRAESSKSGSSDKQSDAKTETKTETKADSKKTTTAPATKTASKSESK